ncbi:MAG: V-type ATP synthase subunit D [Candidatus Hadarchaeales archaeon]
MTKAVSGISPTRMELIRLRQRIALAQKGHDLLEEKRDALMMEFLGLVRRIRELSKEAFGRLSEAHRKLSYCMAWMGSAETLQATLESRKELKLEISTRFIMGVKVPMVEGVRTERNPVQRGYSLHTSSALLDEASAEFERALAQLCELAELSEAVRRIGLELERTRRRVNALEYILIPQLKSMAAFIAFRLDEMERDNFVRLKRIKAMLERREGGA